MRKRKGIGPTKKPDFLIKISRIGTRFPLFPPAYCKLRKKKFFQKDLSVSAAPIPLTSASAQAPRIEVKKWCHQRGEGAHGPCPLAIVLQVLTLLLRPGLLVGREWRMLEWNMEYLIF
jgi:hypothetical protein